jgi:hypothetical protein
MLIWFDPQNNSTPNPDWMWVKRERTLINYIAAQVRGVAIPEGKKYDHLAEEAKAYKVKVTRF